jgi:dynein heavy chain
MFFFICYRLSSLPYYYIPNDCTLEGYRDFIKCLPKVDDPLAFGQHPNADITSLFIETRLLCETLMSLQDVQVSAEEGTSKEDIVRFLKYDLIIFLCYFSYHPPHVAR